MDRSRLLLFSFSSCLSGRDTGVVRAQSPEHGRRATAAAGAARALPLPSRPF